MEALNLAVGLVDPTSGAASISTV
ncbi:hypothetical protein PPSIR1_21224 [Plesiocystis pacifica SIR-1]|uniref:Uncharacterized protein n=1 Tax=Plesiocystis pacifica SIR-1 TaxID=391625 RepID=A6G3I4_9BACT|nr:hypothetical protein PPSIR1_21224 [Plesiocystis pacifica SIR-1]